LFFGLEKNDIQDIKYKSVTLNKITQETLTPGDVYKRRVKKLVDQGRLSFEEHPLKAIAA